MSHDGAEISRADLVVLSSNSARLLHEGPDLIHNRAVLIRIYSFYRSCSRRLVDERFTAIINTEFNGTAAEGGSSPVFAVRTTYIL
jgi:hypothetical protein